MLATMRSIAISGIDAVPVDVELDHSHGTPVQRLVGLPDKAVQEAMDRTKSAIRNSGYDFPYCRLIYSLAPAGMKKEGSYYDLPLALVTLIASEQLTPIEAESFLVLGELGLSGDVRPVPGVLAAAITASQMGLKGVVVPRGNAAEAAALDGIQVVGVESLSQAVGFFAGQWQPSPPEPVSMTGTGASLCYSDMRGQEFVKRGMVIAAAGAHHCLLLGPPGSGKSMAAQRLPSILPPLTRTESLLTTKIHSIAGELEPGQGLLVQRPYRAPHYSISTHALVGGGSVPRPGVLSLAHNGVLFLDEAPEISRPTLEALRQPMEDGVVTISRVAGTETYPARVQLVLAMNLCPCGRRGDPQRRCRCAPNRVTAYLNKISGPLMDRIDLHLQVPPVKHEQLMEKRAGTGSAEMAEQVAAARTIQLERYGDRPSPVNAAMTRADLDRHCQLDRESSTMLYSTLREQGYSARAYGSLLRVARTIADLEGSSTIRLDHLLEATSVRLPELK